MDIYIITVNQVLILAMTFLVYLHYNHQRKTHPNNILGIQNYIFILFLISTRSQIRYDKNKSSNNNKVVYVFKEWESVQRYTETQFVQNDLRYMVFIISLSMKYPDYWHCCKHPKNSDFGELLYFFFLIRQKLHMCVMSQVTWVLSG